MFEHFEHVRTFLNIFIVTNLSFQLLETEISRMCGTWRDQVISYIKEKDRLLNPDLYVERLSTEPADRNPNLFDDDCFENDDVNDSNSSVTSSSDEDSFHVNEVSNHSEPLFNSSHDISNSTVAANSSLEPTNSNTTNREMEVEAEIQKYQNFDREAFAQLCDAYGLKRANSKQFEPVGGIVWEFWRRNKNKYPIIYEAIKCIIQAPTSSSAIEREFSKVSAFVTHQKNAFKSKNLLALIQISEMDDFLRISSDCFRQNNTTFRFKNLNDDDMRNHSSNLISDDFLLI